MPLPPQDILLKSCLGPTTTLTSRRAFLLAEPFLLSYCFYQPPRKSHQLPGIVRWPPLEFSHQVFFLWEPCHPIGRQPVSENCQICASRRCRRQEHLSTSQKNVLRLFPGQIGQIFGPLHRFETCRPLGYTYYDTGTYVAYPYVYREVFGTYRATMVWGTHTRDKKWIGAIRG